MTHESLYKRAEEAQRLAEAASDGPWRWQANPKHKSISLVGGRPTYDLTVMDFVRWGMSDAAPRFRDLSERGLNLMNQVRRWFVNAPKREHHADWFQFVDHPDANLIAAAPSHVALIADLVAALRDMDHFVKRVAELEKAIGNVLPGYTYMDPPDGGNVDLPEQLERMATDAARYRWLRADCNRKGQEARMQILYDTCEEGMDAAIDAKIKEQQS